MIFEMRIEWPKEMSRLGQAQKIFSFATDVLICADHTTNFQAPPHVAWRLQRVVCVVLATDGVRACVRACVQHRHCLGYRCQGRQFRVPCALFSLNFLFLSPPPCAPDQVYILLVPVIVAASIGLLALVLWPLAKRLRGRRAVADAAQLEASSKGLERRLRRLPVGSEAGHVMAFQVGMSRVRARVCG